MVYILSNFLSKFENRKKYTHKIRIRILCNENLSCDLKIFCVLFPITKNYIKSMEFPFKSILKKKYLNIKPILNNENGLHSITNYFVTY